MNAFLWLGVASTVVLVISVVLDGSDGVFDLLDGVDLGGDWLSLPVLAAFLGAFGFGAGAFYDSLGWPAVLVGVVVGLAFAYGAMRLVRAVQTGDGAGADQAGGMLGTLGRIVTSPGPSSLGEVMLTRPNGPLKVACRSDRALPLGTEVVVVEVTSSTLVVVRPFNQELPT